MCNLVTPASIVHGNGVYLLWHHSCWRKIACVISVSCLAVKCQRLQLVAEHCSRIVSIALRMSGDGGEEVGIILQNLATDLKFHWWESIWCGLRKRVVQPLLQAIYMVTRRNKQRRTTLLWSDLPSGSLWTKEPAWCDTKPFLLALNFSHWDKKWTLSGLDLATTEIGRLKCGCFPKATLL